MTNSTSKLIAALGLLGKNTENTTKKTVADYLYKVLDNTSNNNKSLTEKSNNVSSNTSNDTGIIKDTTVTQKDIADETEKDITTTASKVRNINTSLTKLNPAQEIEFQAWWKPISETAGLDPNVALDTQEYDYRKYWATEKAKDDSVEPSIIYDPSSGKIKLPDEYKASVDIESFISNNESDNKDLANYSDEDVTKIANTYYNTKSLTQTVEDNKSLLSSVVKALIKRGAIVPLVGQSLKIYNSIKDSTDTASLQATYNNLLNVEQRGETLNSTDKATKEAIKYKLNL